MSRRYRRYEMLLPLRFNDGQPVPEELNLLTLSELRDRFGAASIETQSIRGEWVHAGLVYRDETFRLFLDVPDTKANQQFFRKYKTLLMERYRQIDIWMTTHSVTLVRAIR